MTVKQARQAARRWIAEEAASVAGFHGAYTAGSTNWLSGDARLSAASDLDVMVVLADTNRVGTRRKFVYRDALLEASYLPSESFQSPQEILGDYHLAASFARRRFWPIPWDISLPCRRPFPATMQNATGCAGAAPARPSMRWRISAPCAQTLLLPIRLWPSYSRRPSPPTSCWWQVCGTPRCVRVMRRCASC